MAARGNTIAQAFSNKVMAELYDKDILENVVNRDYEGEINAIGSKLNVLDSTEFPKKLIQALI